MSQDGYILPEKLRPVATLVPTRSDKEIADDIRNKLIEAYKPVIEMLTYAKKSGFEVNIQTGADAFGQCHVMNIQILKAF